LHFGQQKESNNTVRYQNTIVVAVLFLLLLGPKVSGEDDRIDLGFVNFETVTAARGLGGAQHTKSGIIVRMFDVSHNREVFTISNEAGISVVPLRPGKYCFEAFSITGTRLELDKSQSSCFTVPKDETITVGVVVSSHN